MLIVQKDLFPSLITGRVFLLVYFVFNSTEECLLVLLFSDNDALNISSMLQLSEIADNSNNSSFYASICFVVLFCFAFALHNTFASSASILPWFKYFCKIYPMTHFVLEERKKSG